MLEAGVGHIPTDRQRRGLVLDFTLAENIALHDFDKPPPSRTAGCSRGAWRPRAGSRCSSEFDVRGGGPERPRRSLSGGNQQKVIIAREVSRDPAVLVASQPTRGLDVGAIEYVHKRLVAERDEGRAILLVSLELEEVLSLSDRILVIYEGASSPSSRRAPAARSSAWRCSGRGPRPRREHRRPARAAARAPEPAPPTAEPGRCGRWLAPESGGVVTSIITTILAFLIGGVVVLATGHNPLDHLQGHLQRDRPQLVLPLGQRASSARTRPSTCSRRCSSPPR